MRFIVPKLTHVFHTTVPGGPATLAAIVATDDLTVAFNSTNHIMDSHDWRSNPDVLATGYSNRSTCAGDFMVQGDKVYSVDPLGFSCVNGPVSKAKHAAETVSKWIATRRTKWNANKNA